MPLYEYKCNSCEAEFEMLCRLTDKDEDVVCPDCGEQQAERQISNAANTSSTIFGAFSRGGCSPFS
jgi:putative FmdB family regulatory protein